MNGKCSYELVHQNSSWAECVEENHFDKSLQGGRRVSRESNWVIRGELTNRKMTRLHTHTQPELHHSNSTWSLYYATATNSSPCKKHGVERCAFNNSSWDWYMCVSPETAVWIARCSALRRDSLWTCEDWESGSEFNMRRSQTAATWNPYLLF